MTVRKSRSENYHAGKLWLGLTLFLSTLNSHCWAANAKDLYFEELKTGANTVKGIAYCIELRRPGLRPTLCNNRYAFQNGDAIKIHIKSSRSGYAYVLLAQGSTGKKSLLFPPAGKNEDNQIDSGKEYVVPFTGQLRFDKNPGQELLKIIVSDRRLTVDEVQLQAKNITITSNELTGVPEEKDGVFVISNDGGYDLDTQSNTQGQGQVFVASRDTAKPLAVNVLLTHLGEAGQPPADSAGTPVSFTTPGSVASVLPNTTMQPGSNGHTSNTQPQTATTATTSTHSESSNRPITDKWAFIVGINQYLHGNALSCCVNDARAVKNFLVNEAGFAPNHVLMLLDEDATTANITRVFKSVLPKSISKDDLVLLYFSSHGSGNPTGPNLENYIVTHDTGPTVPGIHMQSLGDMIKTYVPSDRVVTILDTCFAGNAKDIDSKDYLDSLLQGCGQIIASACGPNEFSVESRKTGQGFFTESLLEAFRKERSLRSAFDIARQTTITKVRTQHPVIKYDRWRGNDVVLYAKPSNPKR